MNRDSLKVLILVVCFTFSFSSLIVAQDKDKVRLQGVLMELDLKKRMMMVNETTFFWDANTVFNDSKGVLIPLDKFQVKAWVYVEGEKNKGNKKAAKKVYLLPKYIEEKERSLYPFFQH